MKYSLSALLSAVSLVAAQDYNTSAPFTLKLQSDNANVSGQYLGSCHSGAAIEQLCLAGTALPTNFGTYTLNVSASAVSDDDSEQGILAWNLPTSDFNVSSGLTFYAPLYSNIALPQFQPGPSNYPVGFDKDEKLFIQSGFYDERTFVAGKYPTQVTPVPLYQWYACYTAASGYYYHSLVWVTSGEPVNPTCDAVNVTRSFL